MANVAVIGAGIKGAAVAGLLSACRDTIVTVFEAGDGPTGATVTNHGRLHAGTAGFDADSPELMARRHRGSRVWRACGVGAGEAPALYLFDEPETYARFQASCQAAAIAYRPASELPYGWADDPLEAVEVPEYAFNPAELSGRLRSTAEAAGAQWRTRTLVESVDSADADDGVVLAHAAEALHFDVVVNCSARWSAALPMLWRAEPLFEIEWNVWQILATPAGGLPALNQVVVRARKSGQHASVVPHGKYITLDYKGPASPEPPTAPPGPRPVLRPVWHGDAYLERCILAFAPLADARDVLAFDGIQGRIRGAKPGSVNQIFCDPEVPGYLVAQGGQASTALLDALEVVELLWRRGHVADDPLALLGRLCHSLAPASRSDSALMAWEDERNRI